MRRTLHAIAITVAMLVPRAAGAEPRRERSLVLMVPDLPDDDLDDRTLAAIAAHRDAGASVDVVRYDPARFPAADVVAASRRRAGEFAARGVLWIDLADRSQLAIYLYEVDTDRLLGRRIAASPDAPAAAAETLANITASIVAESAAGPVEGMDEVDPASLDPNAETPAAPTSTEPTADPSTSTDAPSPPTWPRLWLGLGYAGATFSSQVITQHGLALAAAWGPAPGAFVGVRYDLVLPSRVDDRDVVFEIRRHPVALEGGYRFPLGSRRRADVEVAGRFTIDPIVRRSDARASTRPVAADDIRVFTALAPGVGAGFAPIRAIRLGVRIGLEVLTSRARWQIAGAGARVALDPHPVRFFFEAGLQFGLVWRARAPGARGPARGDKD